jgi:integrase
MARQNRPARTRRVRGSGSVFPVVRRGVEVWVARLPVGTGANGRTAYREVSAPTAADVLKKLAALKPPTAGVTVREWCARWLDSLDVRPGTKDSYTNSVTHYVNPLLGHLRLDAVTPFTVEAAAKKWGASRGVGTVRLALAHLRTALQAAVRDRLLASNPVAAARRPKAARKTIDPFTPAEVKRILKAAAAEPNTRVFVLLAATGMRSGEALALDVTDYDPKAGLLAVAKTMHPKHGIGPPKSANGIRTIRVPLAARAALVAAAGGRASGPLFATASGGRGERSLARKPWLRLLKALGLRSRNLHQLRHSWVTNAIAAGVPIADAAKYVGDSPATVVATYLHPSGADPSQAMDRLLGR